MMHTRPLSIDSAQSLALVRALRSLRVGDAEIVSRLVDAFGGAWSVQTGDDYDGYLFMLIEPSAEHTGQLPTYMVSGKTSEIELAIVDGDDCRTLGRFGDIYGLTAELTSRLYSVTSRHDKLAVEAAHRPAAAAQAPTALVEEAPGPAPGLFVTPPGG